MKFLANKQHTARLYLVALLIVVIFPACQQTAEPNSPPPTVNAVLGDSANEEVAAISETAAPTETAPTTATSIPSPTTTNTATPLPTATLFTTPTLTPSPSSTATAQPTRPPSTPSPVPPTATNPPPIPSTALPTTQPPAQPASLPAQGAPPSGPNLLANPGFEGGSSSWGWYRDDNMGIIDNFLGNSSLEPGLVRSGNFSGRKQFRQQIEGLTPGQTYRFGIWAKIWFPDEGSFEAPVRVRLCVNGYGEDDLRLNTTKCGGWVTPMGDWQYLIIDVNAVNDRVFVITNYQKLSPNNPPPSYEVVWDDASFGISPNIVTQVPLTTPTPSPPQRGAAQPFNVDTFRGNINSLQSNIQQLGGLLDRLYRGSRETCEEFNRYYKGIASVSFFTDVPEDWAALHSDYQFAAEHVTDTNRDIYLICSGGGGGLTELVYGTSRIGINDALDRLNPAVDTVNQR